MIRIVLVLAVAMSMASCGAVRNTAGALGVGSSAVGRTTIEADGVRYRARTSADRGDRRNFTATASPISPSVEAAIEAAAYQATRYCILTFGGSDTEWTVGPDTPPEELSLAEGQVTLSGRCTQK